MAEVGFYHLLRVPLERALPRLLEKAREAGYRALVVAGSQERVAALDDALWTYDPASFLAHGSDAESGREEQPILISTAFENVNRATLLVCTDGVAPPPELDGFARVLDLFDGNDPEAVAAARERWRAYATAGHDLTYWQQTEAGGWERKA